MVAEIVTLGRFPENSGSWKPSVAPFRKRLRELANANQSSMISILDCRENPE